MWLNDIGQVRPEGRERNHFGMYTCADGRTFEGHNVDNHFDCMNLQVRYLNLIRAPYFLTGLFFWAVLTWTIIF